MDDAAVQRSSRLDLARALSPRYKHASRPDKTLVLDEFCRLTGYSRKYALVLLRQPPPPGATPPVKRRRRRPRHYGEAELALLRLCWTVSDGICAKRLAPFLPELLGRLRAYQALRSFAPETIARVAGLSASTIDRALRGWRPRGVRHGFSTTRPGTLLKQQVAIKTFADWDAAQAGSFEMDLVAHCGWTVAGQFLYTLCIVDVATGWVACAGLRDKRQETVLHALQRLARQLPMPIRGLDSDNGTEFLSRELIAYCASNGITFTRARPYRKNDNCHVEQKNWAVVRRLVGYDRLELPALPALERLHDLAHDYVNFLHPVRKLVRKSRDGARIQRWYDRAQTPYQRLLQSGCLSPEARAELEARSVGLDPLRLKLDVELAQRTLAARAARSDAYVRQSA